MFSCADAILRVGCPCKQHLDVFLSTPATKPSSLSSSAHRATCPSLPSMPVLTAHSAACVAAFRSPDLLECSITHEHGEKLPPEAAAGSLKKLTVKCFPCPPPFHCNHIITPSHQADGDGTWSGTRPPSQGRPIKRSKRSAFNA